MTTKTASFLDELIKTRSAILKAKTAFVRASFPDDGTASLLESNMANAEYSLRCAFELMQNMIEQDFNSVKML